MELCEIKERKKPGKKLWLRRKIKNRKQINISFSSMVAVRMLRDKKKLLSQFCHSNWLCIFGHHTPPYWASQYGRTDTDRARFIYHLNYEETAMKMKKKPLTLLWRVENENEIGFLKKSRSILLMLKAAVKPIGRHPRTRRGFLPRLSHITFLWRRVWRMTVRECRSCFPMRIGSGEPSGAPA